MGLLDVVMRAAEMYGRPQKAVNDIIADPRQRQGLLDAAAISTSPAPVVGDAMGLLSDVHRYATQPEERTLGNFGLTGMSLLPIVPPLLSVGRAAKGGKVGLNGYTYKGGQFLPSTELPPGMFKVGGKRVGPKVVEIERGVRQPQPSPFAVPLFQQFGGYIDWRHADKTGEYRLIDQAPKDAAPVGWTVAGKRVEGERFTLQELLDQWKSGARWIDLGDRAKAAGIIE